MVGFLLFCILVALPSMASTDISHNTSQEIGIHKRSSFHSYVSERDSDGALLFRRAPPRTRAQTRAEAATAQGNNGNSLGIASGGVQRGRGTNRARGNQQAGGRGQAAGGRGQAAGGRGQAARGRGQAARGRGQAARGRGRAQNQEAEDLGQNNNPAAAPQPIPAQAAVQVAGPAHPIANPPRPQLQQPPAPVPGVQMLAQQLGMQHVHHARPLAAAGEPMAIHNPRPAPVNIPQFRPPIPRPANPAQIQNPRPAGGNAHQLPPVRPWPIEAHYRPPVHQPADGAAQGPNSNPPARWPAHNHPPPQGGILLQSHPDRSRIDQPPASFGYRDMAEVHTVTNGGVGGHLMVGLDNQRQRFRMPANLASSAEAAHPVKASAGTVIDPGPGAHMKQAVLRAKGAQGVIARIATNPGGHVDFRNTGAHGELSTSVAVHGPQGARAEIATHSPVDNVSSLLHLRGPGAVTMTAVRTPRPAGGVQNPGTPSILSANNLDEDSAVDFEVSQ